MRNSHDVSPVLSSRAIALRAHGTPSDIPENPITEPGRSAQVRAPNPRGGGRRIRRIRHGWQVFGLAGTGLLAAPVTGFTYWPSLPGLAPSACDGGRSCIPLRDSPGFSPDSLSPAHRIPRRANSTPDARRRGSNSSAHRRTSCTVKHRRCADGAVFAHRRLRCAVRCIGPVNTTSQAC
jgi:hypothetical protein